MISDPARTYTARRIRRPGRQRQDRRRPDRRRDLLLRLFPGFPIDFQDRRRRAEIRISWIRPHRCFSSAGFVIRGSQVPESFDSISAVDGVQPAESSFAANETACRWPFVSTARRR